MGRRSAGGVGKRMVGWSTTGRTTDTTHAGLLWLLSDGEVVFSVAIRHEYMKEGGGQEEE